MGIITFNLVIAYSTPVTASGDITANDLLDSHNLERVRSGLPPLTLNTSLNDSAEAKAQAMLDSDCWSHYCPDGKSPWDFFVAAGYDYEFAGENLAEGFVNYEAVMNAWMESPTHRENILNRNFTEIGFGFVSGNYQGKRSNLIIVVHFGQSKFGAVADVASAPVSEGGTITVNNLKDNEILNQQFIEVTGLVEPENSVIDIFFNDEVVGRVNAEGDNYVFRSERNLEDGLYKVYSSVASSVLNIDSRVYTVRIDGGLPQLIESTMEVYQLNEDEVIFEFETTDDVFNIISKSSIEDLYEFDKNKWRLTAIVDRILPEGSILLELEDFSENVAEFSITVDELLLNSDELFSEENNQLVKQSVPAKFISRIVNGNAAQVVPVVFSGFLILLFLIDFIVLAKTDMLHQVGRKPHAQLSLLIMLFIAISIGGISGSVLNGATI